MIYEHKNISLSEIFVANRRGEASFVVIFPVTRTGSKNMGNWARILEIINKSQVNALVVLDKTPAGEATDYFSNNAEFLNADLYLVSRKPSEAIYDSQSIVVVDSNLWILQFHDDDYWEGVLTFPNSPREMQLFSPSFFLSGMQMAKELEWTQSPPARINFTAIPSKVWNRFTLFIRSQGGHAAGSVDSTLNLMCRLSCEYSKLETLTYNYDNRHWENQRKAKRNLEKLALEDGWNRLASEEIQLLNRRIDTLIALYFFKDLINSSLINFENSLIQEFKLSGKKRIQLRAKTFLNILIQKNVASKLIYRYIKQSSNYYNKISNRIDLYKLILLSTKVKSKHDVLILVELIRKQGTFPLLEDRFHFWKSILNQELAD